MKVLLTGGAGYIGSVLSNILIKNKIKVYIVDNLSTGYPLNINKYHSTRTIENRSHGATLEYKKIKTWVKYNTNLMLNSLVSRFKARTTLQELYSPSYIGRSANTLKSQVWDYCRGQARSTRDIMSHVGINNPQSVRRTISEIRSIDQ